MKPETLIAREAEIAAIKGFLDHSGPRGLVLEGEPGIGKTSVWAAGVEAADMRGMTVLEARATGAEVRLSFAGLADLLGRLPDSAAISRKMASHPSVSGTRGIAVAERQGERDSVTV